MTNDVSSAQKSLFFWTFYCLDGSQNGVNKKVEAQIKGFEANGVTVYALREKEENNRTCLYVELPGTHEIEVLLTYPAKRKNPKWRIWLDALTRNRRIRKAIGNFCTAHAVSHVYVRFLVFKINQVIALKKAMPRLHFFLEFPTFPYAPELKKFGCPLTARLREQYRDRPQYARTFDAALTLTDAEHIFNMPNIAFQNGVPEVKSLPLVRRKKTPDDPTCRAIAVAHFSPAHGIDRLLNAMETARLPHFHLDLVGKGLCFPALQVQVNSSPFLREHVTLHGEQSGTDLDRCFESADFGIGVLGGHRVNIPAFQPLKHREYLGRGLPVLYSSSDPGLDGLPFVCRVPAGESAFDLNAVLAWYARCAADPACSPEALHAYACAHFDWAAILKPITARLFNQPGLLEDSTSA